MLILKRLFNNNCQAILSIILLFKIYSYIILYMFSSVCYAQSKPSDLAELSLEQLMNLEVSASTPLKKDANIYEIPSGITVINSDDIRRSGYTNIPDLLRLVPGMQVARIDANKWAISSRGFTGVFANKLLVLIDGRSVYTPFFSGVFWESQDVLLDDIDRIEVIRGPGASLWGANAVNGIINIITKNAKATHGGHAKLGFGTEEKFFCEIQYGKKIGANLSVRAYSKYFSRDNFKKSDGETSADKWDMLRNGFRMDWDLSDHDFITLEGDFYNGKVGQMYNTITSPQQQQFQYFDSTASTSGKHILGKWEHDFSYSSELIFQFYADHAKRNDVILNGEINTFDFDLQHRFNVLTNHEFMWGVGYRFITDEFAGTYMFHLNMPMQNTEVISGFIQDEIKLFNDKLHFTLGTKIEKNDYTGLEIQPNLRMLWNPNPYHSYWAALSRAVRTPSRVENDVSYIIDLIKTPWLPAILTMNGDHDFDSEKLLAYEFGYRVRVTKYLFIDIALFYNKYNDLRTYELDSNGIDVIENPPHIIVPVYVDNNMYGNTYGGEFVLQYHLSDFWHIRAAYSYLRFKLYLQEIEAKDPLTDLYKNSYYSTLAKGTDGESPRNQLMLRNTIQLTNRLNTDIIFHYVDILPKLKINSYTNLNISLNIQLNDKLGISIVGQNLLEKRHPEYAPSYSQIIASEVERGLYGAINIKF